MKNKKIIISIIVLALLAGGLLVLGRPSAEDGTPAVLSTEGVAGGQIVVGSLTASEGSFDFGSISMARGKVARVFRIANSGTDPITIQKIYTSCMCTTADLIIGDREFGPYGMPGHGMLPSINAVLEPAAEGNIRVVFDPAAHGPAGIGTVTRVVYVETKESGTLELSISATVTP